MVCPSQEPPWEGTFTMLPYERETRLCNGSANHALLFGSGDAVAVWIDPETALHPLCKGEVVAVGVKGVPFDENAPKAVFALGCAGDECFNDLFVGHGIVCCWLRDQSSLVFNPVVSFYPMHLRLFPLHWNQHGVDLSSTEQHPLRPYIHQIRALKICHSLREHTKEDSLDFASQCICRSW